MYKSKKRKIRILALVLSLTVLSFSMSAAATVAPPAAPDGTPPGGMGTSPEGAGAPPSGGADTMTYDYTGALNGVLSVGAGQQLASRDASIGATDPDQNAALVQAGGVLSVTNGTLHKTGDDTNGDNCNFYGINSIFLATGENTHGAISNSDLTSESEGSNGIFSTDKAEVFAKGNAIHTSGNNSRGMDATYGGTIIADDISITTMGEHCAAIATDRGGGKISATNSSLNTTGSGSPLLYSTGNIQVDHVTGTASGSQIAGMEGLNTILIFNSDLKSTIEGKTASDPVANGIIIYQSTSGDAEAATGETATFQAVNSQLTSAITSGAMFYVTNTNANILLSGSVLDFDSKEAKLLRIEGNNSNNWGTAGANGGKVKFTARNETLTGDISVDTISSLDLYLLDGSTYMGTIALKEAEEEEEKQEDNISVSIGGDSKWIVTANSTIANLSMEEGASIEDPNGNAVTVMKNGETVVSGNSTFTVTVTNQLNSSIAADASNEVNWDVIDRGEFDTYYECATTFGENGQVELTPTEIVVNLEEDDTAEAAENKSAKKQLAVDVAIAVAVCALIGLLLYRRKKARAKKSASEKNDEKETK